MPGGFKVPYKVAKGSKCHSGGKVTEPAGHAMPVGLVPSAKPGRGVRPWPGAALTGGDACGTFPQVIIFFPILVIFSVVLVAVGFVLVAVVVAAAAGLVLVGVASGMVLVGLLVGVGRKSVAAGLRACFWAGGILGGAGLGLVAVALVTWLFGDPWLLIWWWVAGALFGGVLGLLAAAGCIALWGAAVRRLACWLSGRISDQPNQNPGLQSNKPPPSEAG